MILMYLYKMPSILLTIIFLKIGNTLWSSDCCKVFSLCFSQQYHKLKNLVPGWQLSALSAEFLSLDSPTTHAYHVILN